MKTRSFLIAVMLLLSMVGRAQGLTVFIVDNDGDWTNLRNAPKGKVVYKLPAHEGVMINIEHVENGWWKLGSTTGYAGDFEYNFKGSTTGYWIHWSVIAIGTRNYGGGKITLRKEPSAKSAAVFSFTNERNLRVLDIKGDWVKVRTLDGKYTGWMEDIWVCGNSLTNCC